MGTQSWAGIGLMKPKTDIIKKFNRVYIALDSGDDSTGIPSLNARIEIFDNMGDLDKDEIAHEKQCLKEMYDCEEVLTEAEYLEMGELQSKALGGI
jgi:hypothetical protein